MSFVFTWASFCYIASFCFNALKTLVIRIFNSIPSSVSTCFANSSSWLCCFCGEYNLFDAKFNALVAAAAEGRITARELSDGLVRLQPGCEDSILGSPRTDRPLNDEMMEWLFPDGPPAGFDNTGPRERPRRRFVPNVQLSPEVRAEAAADSASAATAMMAEHGHPHRLPPIDVLLLERQQRFNRYNFPIPFPSRLFVPNIAHRILTFSTLQHADRQFAFINPDLFARLGGMRHHRHHGHGTFAGEERLVYIPDGLNRPGLGTEIGQNVPMTERDRLRSLDNLYV